MIEREKMLKHLWDNINTDKHLRYVFSDGSSAYFLRQLKIEMKADKFEIYNTGTEMYNLLPDSAVWYAYNNSIEDLSKSVVKTKCEERLYVTKYQQLEPLIKKYRDTLKNLNTLNIPNLKQIKEDYERQRATD